ncbi:hypothetical protein LOZ51_005810 [Ophidiomyces ophidiicola]|nr:hypothetical protein LOZ51_005810 [Ophidiomyces ophidiicola]KAI1989027.1 hypothetical protein LOZ54_003032 [Ophidiomyces ophidiicola]
MGARDMVNQMCLLGSSTCHISCANKNPPPYNDCYTQSISGFHGNVEGISPQLDYARESCEAEEDSTGMNQSHNEQYGIESPEPQGDDECQSLFSTTSGDGAFKKKMKRFRLSRNQTRYLMSEFTRQAHPDAAQRERLSREIPGLSPRQVQVWFQNRRAKLKRMSIDDRERVLKSRAIPDSFDMAKALNWPYATYSGASSKPAASINLKDLIKKDSSTLTEPSTFLGGEYANVTTSDISSSAYYTPISQPASNSDTNLENASSTVGYREAPFTQWAYSQIPSPPLDSAVASEPESFGESESPPNSHWFADAALFGKLSNIVWYTSQRQAFDYTTAIKKLH